MVLEMFSLCREHLLPQRTFSDELNGFFSGQLQFFPQGMDFVFELFLSGMHCCWRQIQQARGFEMGIFFPIGEFINDQLQFPRTLLPLKNFPHFSKQIFLPICTQIPPLPKNQHCSLLLTIHLYNFLAVCMLALKKGRCMAKEINVNIARSITRSNHR